MDCDCGFRLAGAQVTDIFSCIILAQVVNDESQGSPRLKYLILVVGIQGDLIFPPGGHHVGFGGLTGQTDIAPLLPRHILQGTEKDSWPLLETTRHRSSIELKRALVALQENKQICRAKKEL